MYILPIGVLTIENHVEFWVKMEGELCILSIGVTTIEKPAGSIKGDHV